MKRISLLTLALAGVSSAQQTFAPQPTLPASTGDGMNLLPTLQNATAPDAQTVCPGYKASNIRETSSGVMATLSLAGAACNVYGTDVKQLTLSVTYQSKDRINVKIIPADLGKEESWYIVNPNQISMPTGTIGSKDSDWAFSYEKDPFSFTITRKSTKEVVFTTKGSKIVFENQFVEWKTTVPSGANIYGFGDAITDRFRLGENNRTIYAADIGDNQDANLYGTHPFYLEQRYSNGKGYSHGVYSRNFYGQDILLRDTSITYRTIGGSIDLYFYSGPTPAKVSESYITSIGKPGMQQYWTFGFHQCRWGYKNISELDDVVESYKRFGIPMETIWTDIDYMFQYRDFTTDPNTYPQAEFKKWLDKLHKGGQKYVPIVDAAIYIPNPKNKSDAYKVYDDGHELDVYMKNPDGSEYIGAVWPGFTVFPDWSAKNTQKWWSKLYVDWFKEVPYDGIWLDMNEVSSFCVGSCGSGELNMNPIHPPFSLPGEPGGIIYSYPEGFNITNSTEAAAASAAADAQAAAASKTAAPATTKEYFPIPPVETGKRNINYPPYAINNYQGNHDLAVHRVGPNATHADGTSDYSVASLWGYLETKATYKALLEVFPRKRPFILSRSSAPGSGTMAAHWGGDNQSTFYYMRKAIQQALNFALFGIPFFGPDTCGFGGNSDLELCSRWMQLSAFFTFYRNHNVLSANSQEAYVWADVAEASKKAMDIRYKLLPYMYTLFYHAHVAGSTVMRALSWEFPDDKTLATIDDQFMLGPGLMVVPALDQGQTTVKGVFPGGSNERWYDWYTHAAMPHGTVEVAAPLGHIPVYVRGGYFLPMQKPAYTTTESRKNNFQLLVALDANGHACGDLYLDDGETQDTKDFRVVSFTAQNGCLNMKVKNSGNCGYDRPLDHITVLGVNKAPKGYGHSYNSTTGSLELDVKLGGWAKADGWKVCWN
jgi:alpha-glucosidase